LSVSFLVILPGVIVSGIFILQESWTANPRWGCSCSSDCVGTTGDDLAENATVPASLGQRGGSVARGRLSFRARNAVATVLSRAVTEVNSLADMLADQHIGRLSHGIVAKSCGRDRCSHFCVDPYQILQLVNSAGNCCEPSVRL
jgi:hypothetical protein